MHLTRLALWEYRTDDSLPRKDVTARSSTPRSVEPQGCRDSYLNVEPNYYRDT